MADTINSGASSADLPSGQLGRVLLQACNVSRPMGANLGLLQLVVQTFDAQITEPSFHDELKSLEQRGLIDLATDGLGKSFATITTRGVGVVEYLIEDLVRGPSAGKRRGGRACARRPHSDRAYSVIRPMLGVQASLFMQ